MGRVARAGARRALAARLDPLARLAALRHRLAQPPPREALIREHARGRSFLDVGALWSVDGALCFAALDAGATSATALDVIPSTEGFDRENARRGEPVRLVVGDLHDPATVAAAGPHDVVWCSGVLYHAPHPLLTLERLRGLTAPDGVLLLATETLRGRGRRATFAPDPGAHPAHTEPFDPAGGYGPWWWGLTTDAVEAMAEASGFAIAARHRRPLHLTLVLKPTPN